MTHVSPHIVPGLRHLVLGEIDLVGDVLVFHGADSFQNRPIPMGDIKKRPSSHQKSPGRSLWDKSLKLLRCHPNWRKLAHSATCQHTSFLGNGGKARRYLLGIPFSPPSAVHSAGSSLPPSHHRRLSWKKDIRVLVCVIGLLGQSLRPNSALCQEKKINSMDFPN